MKAICMEQDPRVNEHMEEKDVHYSIIEKFTLHKSMSIIFNIEFKV